MYEPFLHSKVKVVWLNLGNVHTTLELNFIALQLPNLQFIPSKCQIPLSLQFQTSIICDTAPTFTHSLSHSQPNLFFNELTLK